MPESGKIKLELREINRKTKKNKGKVKVTDESIDKRLTKYE